MNTINTINFDANIHTDLDTPETVILLETPKSKEKNKSKKAKGVTQTPTETVYDFETLKFSIQDIISDLIKSNTLDVAKIPNIDLYVDQLTTFIEDNLYSNKENQLTKSMVNNYCKNKVIPSAEKKKYTKTHILLLIVMYNTKTVLSLPDIEKIFKSINAEDVTSYYNYVTDFMVTTNELLCEATLNSFENIHKSDFKENSKSELAILATQLAMEANVKKMLAEIIIEKYL